MTARRNKKKKLNVACIGVGGIGWIDMQEVGDWANIVALCDVDEHSLERAKSCFPKAAKYIDYREMLEKEKNIQAVTVSVPDHMHAPISVMAMNLGKHCYCQKPLARTISETRLMAATSNIQKIVTQMGTQGLANKRTRQGINILRSGVLGQVNEVHIWTDKRGKFWSQSANRSASKVKSPPHLHWNNWIGVAPYRSYEPSLHPAGWRKWVDFGTGAIGDMGCHIFALPFLGLNLGLPTTVEAEFKSNRGDQYPEWSKTTFDFPMCDGQPSVRVYWYDGGKKPPRKLFDGYRIDNNGSLVIGTDGKYYSPGPDGSFGYLLPLEQFANKIPPLEDFVEGRSHHQEWVEACLGKAEASANFIDFAANITEVMLLGNLAIHLGRKIEWDAEKMQVKNCPEADEYIYSNYRNGW